MCDVCVCVRACVRVCVARFVLSVPVARVCCKSALCLRVMCLCRVSAQCVCATCLLCLCVASLCVACLRCLCVVMGLLLAKGSPLLLEDSSSSQVLFTVVVVLVLVWSFTCAWHVQAYGYMAPDSGGQPPLALYLCTGPKNRWALCVLQGPTARTS